MLFGLEGEDRDGYQSSTGGQSLRNRKFASGYSGTAERCTPTRKLPGEFLVVQKRLPDSDKRSHNSASIMTRCPRMRRMLASMCSVEGNSALDIFELANRAP